MEAEDCGEEIAGAVVGWSAGYAVDGRYCAGDGWGGLAWAWVAEELGSGWGCHGKARGVLLGVLLYGTPVV